MRPRSLGRRLAMQYLFMDDLCAGKGVEEARAFLADQCDRPEAAAFAHELIAATKARLAMVDTLLAEVAEHWDLDRVAAVERNLLRVATTELMLAETPDAVVLDEAVRLAKQFGGKDSGGFVNGLLDKVRQRLRAPGPAASGPVSPPSIPEAPAPASTSPASMRSAPTRPASAETTPSEDEPR